MIHETLKQIIKKWQAENIPIRAGVSPESIAEFEAKYQVVLPADVREYFMTVDGTGDHMTEYMLHRFWPLAEVTPVEQFLKNYKCSHRFAFPNYFVFADHSICIFEYAARLTNDPNLLAPVIRIYNDDFPCDQVAASFSEFMTLFSHDEASIL